MVVFILDEGVISGIAVLRVDFRDVILYSWFFVLSIFGNRIDSKIIMDAVLQIGYRTACPCTAVHLCSIVRVCRCRINLLDDLCHAVALLGRVCPCQGRAALVWGQHKVADLIWHIGRSRRCNRAGGIQLEFVLAVVCKAAGKIGVLPLHTLGVGKGRTSAFVDLYTVGHTVRRAALLDNQHHACKVFVRWICPCKDNARRFSFWCARLHIAHLRRQRSWRSAAGRSPAPAGGFVKVDGHHLASLPRIIERRVGALIEVVGGVLHHDHIALDKGAWHLQGNGKNSGIPHREQRRHLEAPACFQHRAGVGKVGPARCSLFELLKVFYQFLHIRSIGIIRQVKP